MNQLKHIAAGVDFSACSSIVVREAARIAKINQAKLTLYHVVDEHVLRELKQYEHISRDNVINEAIRQIEELIESSSSKGMEIDIKVLEGHPLECINNAINNYPVNLFVAGVHGTTSSGQEPGVFATQCVRHLNTNVFLVDTEQNEGIGRVVACIDFSDHTDEVLEQAICLAKIYNANLHLLHVYFGPWHQMHYRAPTPEADPDFINEYKTILKSKLDHLLDKYKEEVQGLTISDELHECSNHGDGVLDVLQEHKADVAVLGTHNHNPIFNFFVGSTAEKVLRKAPCSLLTIRPK